MLELDGGDAGGQFLRTALSLSVLTDTPVTLRGIRGDRPDPGLRPQHLAVVEVLSDCCEATVTGAQTGATTVTFEPGPIRHHQLSVDVGTAGSVSLVFDAVLPLAPLLDAPLSVTATGGTDVAWSPPLAYLDRVKLPLLRQHGMAAAVERERTGFYPAGAGRATLHVAPSTPARLALTERGTGRGVDVLSLASEDLADADVAERQATAVRDRLTDAGLGVRHVTTTDADAESTGSAVVAVLDYATTCAGFAALGERGTPAEDVGEQVASSALAFHEGTAVVDRHMGDQLLVFGAVAGCELAIPTVTDHVETSLSLLEAFGADCSVDSQGTRPTVTVDPVEPRIE